MRTTERRPSLADGIGLGIIATGAVSVGIGAIVAVAAAAAEIFGRSPAIRMPVHDTDLPALDDPKQLLSWSVSSTAHWVSGRGGAD